MISVISEDDGCCLVWSEDLNGPVLGSWDGVLRTFPNEESAESRSWVDSLHPTDPIRGLIATSDKMFIVCNDFNLIVIDISLTNVSWKLAAREDNTCMLGH